MLVWAQSVAKSLSLMVTFIWVPFTALFWITDCRHRSAMRQLKRVGKAEHFAHTRYLSAVLGFRYFTPFKPLIQRRTNGASYASTPLSSACAALPGWDPGSGSAALPTWMGFLVGTVKRAAGFRPCENPRMSSLIEPI
jgi:hypothetical protein